MKATDVSKEQGIAMGLAIICAIMLFAKEKKVNIAAYFALILLVCLSFAFPLFTIVLFIPVTLIVYIDSYKSLGDWWTQLQKVKLIDDN